MDRRFRVFEIVFEYGLADGDRDSKKDTSNRE